MSIIARNTTQHQVEVDDLEKIQEALQALRETEELESNLLSYGINGIDLHVANLEGDWLECWED